LKIGINAGILTHDITGVGRYLVCLLNEFSKNGSHEYFIYLPQEIDLTGIVPSNMTIRHSCFPRGIGKKIWEQTVLPNWARRDKLDIFWSPSHHLPLWLASSTVKVVTIHDVVWKKSPETMVWWRRLSEAILMPLTIKRADHIITVSCSTRDDVIQSWPTVSKNITVIYPGMVRFESDKENNKNHVDASEYYILFVGTLEPRKNLVRLIQAYSVLPSKFRLRYKLKIVGGKGWGGERLLDEYSDDIKNNIEFMGYLSDLELGRLYRDASLFAMPSLYEGFGLPLLEAMYYGIPVLTSNCSSMPEVVAEAGVLVDPYDFQSIANGIVKILSDKKLSEELLALSQKRISNFSWEKSAVQILSLFEESIPPP